MVATDLWKKLGSAVLDIPPSSLGWPGLSAQSSYYDSEERVSRDDLSYVSEIMERNAILPENTRLSKVRANESIAFNLLQASVETNSEPLRLAHCDERGAVYLQRGDHGVELEKICSDLSEAMIHASNPRQKTVLRKYIESFQSGDLEAYRESQRNWVKDLSPAVENIFGFVEPYRDPAGTRAEFEGIVAIKDAKETETLRNLVEISPHIIQLLPWAEGATSNNGKGPFEKSLFEPPDFTSIHGHDQAP